MLYDAGSNIGMLAVAMGISSNLSNCRDKSEEQWRTTSPSYYFNLGGAFALELSFITATALRGTTFVRPRLRCILRMLVLRRYVFVV